jgi:hypothetical protein
MATPEEKIKAGCQRLGPSDIALLREIFEIEPEKDVCTEVSKQLAKVKKQLRATSLIVGLLNEGIPEA